MRRKLIAGNWKMNGLRAGGVALAGTLAQRLREAGPQGWDMLICPPAPLLVPVAEAILDSPIALGGQDCHSKSAGAHTGDISAAMLKDAGCSYVIVGHSERRGDHGEDDALVRAKAKAALAAGLSPVVCVGETEAEREAGETLSVIQRQIEGSLPWQVAPASLVVAYEPVWAIGTGRTSTSVDIAEVHAHIRALLTQRLGEAGAAMVRVLDSGSVKQGNAVEILAVANVDGALVGGASLRAEDFWTIAAAAA